MQFFLGFIEIIGFCLSLLLFFPLRWFRSGVLWMAQIFATEYCFGLSFGYGLMAAYPDLDLRSKIICFILGLLFFLEVFRALQSGEWSLLTSLRIPVKSAAPKEITLTESGSDWTQTALAWGTWDGDQPLIIVIHGGGWRHGDARQLPVVSSWLADRGFSVLSLNYKKRPGVHMSEILKDIDQSLSVIFAQRKGNGQVWLWGRSAGGHLALCAGKKWAESLRGIIAFYPVTAMSRFYESGREYDILNTRKLLRLLFAGSPPEKAKDYERASPVHLLQKPCPPVLLIHGLRDPVVPAEQSQILAEHLQKLNQPVETLFLPRASHGFDGHWQGPSSQMTQRVVLQFLKRTRP